MKTRAMILESVDGQEYARVILLPDSMDLLEADDLAKAAITKVAKENPEEFTWNDVAKDLEASGFIIPESTTNGPTWDRPR